MNKLIVGIDVSEAKLDVAFLNSDSQPVRNDASFSNSSDGIEELIRCCIASCAFVGKKSQIVVGMESTSNFHKNLEKTLRQSCRNFQIHVINPVCTKQFRKMNLKVCKTDKIDARMIAAYLAKISPEPCVAPLAGQEELKRLTRIRRSFQEEITRNKNRLRSLLRIDFPGYKQHLGKKITRKMLVAFSQYASPEEILEVGSEFFAHLKLCRTMKIGQSFAQKFIQLAQKAPKSLSFRSNAMLIKWAARRILELQEQIKELDTEIESFLDIHFPGHKLLTIPGVGPISVATIIAETGDIKRFSTPEKYIGYIGLYPVVWESGAMKAHYKMTCKGNKHLKMTFLLATAAARRFNPVIAQMYARLRARGKSTKAAGGAIARKLACIVYAILTKDQEWDPGIAAEGLHKSQLMAEEMGENKEGSRHFSIDKSQYVVCATKDFKGNSNSPSDIILQGGQFNNP